MGMKIVKPVHTNVLNTWNYSTRKNHSPLLKCIEYVNSNYLILGHWNNNFLLVLLNSDWKPHKTLECVNGTNFFSTCWGSCNFFLNINQLPYSGFKILKCSNCNHFKDPFSNTTLHLTEFTYPLHNGQNYDWIDVVPIFSSHLNIGRHISTWSIQSATWMVSYC